MKKTLALILAIVMCFSLFVMGASATTEEFTDKAEIDHTEAVNLLVGLGVINGMGDGTFAPDGTVTRAQMCQIVAKICNGGKLPNVNTTEQHFTDVPTNHWAFQAVEYCVGKGIVAGMGDGTFKPDQALTASQCAKMLLVAMGYNETAHKLTGASWEIYTAIYANANDFYDELEDIAVDQPITREHVAQMARNMLDAPVVKANQQVDSNGVITTTYSQTNAAGTADNNDVIEEYFGVVIENGYITGYSYNKTKGEWTYDVTSDACFGGDAIADNDDPVEATSLIAKVDYTGLIGRKVVFVYDQDDIKNVLDIYAHEDSSVVLTGIIDDMPDDVAAADTKIKVDDVTYKLTNKASQTLAYNFYDTDEAIEEIDMTTLYTLNGWYNVALIDNTGDEKIDVAIVTPVTTAKISALTKSSISFTKATYNGLEITDLTGIDIDDEGWNFAADLAKKDFVVITEDSKEVYNVTAMTKVTGKATAIKSSGEKAKIEGTYYNFTPAGETAEINSTYDVQVYNGFAFDVDKTGAGSTDLLLVKSTSEDQWGDLSAKVMFPDGTAKTVTVADGNDDDDEVATADEVEEYTLYTYEVNKDGDYELTALVEGDDDSDNHAGFDGYDATNVDFVKADSKTAAKLNGMIIDDTATIMVRYNTTGTAKYTVITGATLKTYNLEDNLSIAQVLYSTTNGVDKVQFAFIETAKKSFGTDDIFGYVTKVVDTTKVDGTTYTNCLVYTVDGQIEASIENASSLKKGDCIVLTQNSDGTYDLDKTKTGEFILAAITGYSESDELVTIYTLDNNGKTSLKIWDDVTPDDLTVIDVNNDDHKGIGSGDIETADKDDNDVYTANAMVYVEDDDTLCLIIDTADNDWEA